MRLIRFIALPLLVLVLFTPVGAYAIDPDLVLVLNEVAIREDQDWVELRAVNGGNLEGIQLYEGAAVLLKEFPGVVVEGGDRILVHLNDNIGQDESNLLGKGDNDRWDFYSSDTGLIATDNILRLQAPGVGDGSQVTVIDSLVWSNHDGRFTASVDTVAGLAVSGEWQASDFAHGDQWAWGDSDDVLAGQTIVRVSNMTDTNTAQDWSIHGDLTPTPTIVFLPSVTPVPTVTLVPTPTLIPVIVNANFSEKIEMGIMFDLGVEVKHARPNASYSAKFEVQNETGQWYLGKTLGESEEWLAWNTAWESFPQFRTDSNGAGKITIQAQVKSEIEAGNYRMRVKLLEVETDKVFVTEESLRTVDLVVEPGKQVPTNPNQDNLATEKSALPILLIVDIREKQIGEMVRVEGVVTAGPEVLGSRTMYIEDGSSGIKVLLDRKDRDDIKYQDLVEVVGTMGESFDESYIKVGGEGDIIVLGQGDLPEPLVITTGQVGETQEGQLLTVNGEVVATAGNTFYLDDGSGEAKVYIKDSTKIDKPLMRKGYYALVTGINNQYKDDYRILPRFQSDLVVSTIPIEQDGKVLGARTEVLANSAGALTELPQTGYSSDGVGMFLLWLGLILRRLGSKEG